MNAEQLQRLQALRRVLWNSRGNRPHELGIWLVWKTRYQSTADYVAEEIRALGGECWIERARTMVGDGCKYRPWVLNFTVGVPADSYLAKLIDLRELRKWAEDFEARKNRRTP